MVPSLQVQIRGDVEHELPNMTTPPNLTRQTSVQSYPRLRLHIHIRLPYNDFPCNM
jgi:hypothetical protein